MVEGGLGTRTVLVAMVEREEACAKGRFSEGAIDCEGGKRALRYLVSVCLYRVDSTEEPHDTTVETTLK